MKEHIHHLLEQTVANLKSAGVLPADLEARAREAKMTPGDWIAKSLRSTLKTP